MKPARTTSEERSARVQEIKDDLEKTHGSKYNTCQYRLWAEMIFAGVHKDEEEPPQVPMFGTQRKHARASVRGSPDSSVLSDALTGVAVAIRDVLSPQPTKVSTSSPSKAVDLRSKYLQQLKELMSLYEMGALTNTEFQEERSTVVRQMRKLQRDD